MNDSITKLDIQVLDMESEEISGSELGAIKYVSELLDWDVKKTANLFILILIFVFDPLAITLVIATNQAFKSMRRKEDDNSPKQEEDSPKEILKVEDNVVLEEIDSPKQEEESLKVEDNVDTDEVEEDTNVPHKEEYPEQIINNENIEKLVDLQEESKRVWSKVKELKEQGLLPKQTEEEMMDEPTALAFTPYETEEIGKSDINENEDKKITKRLVYTKKDA
jgi:hypothetical protein